MKKLITAIATLMIFTANSVYASILGSVLKESTSLPIGQGLVLNYNKFLSDQKGVGNQSEYYAEYTPNTSAVPVVLTGEDIYGKRNALEAIEYMKNNDMVPMLGINASYFSFQTGIPMGHVITDGVVTSKDNRSLPAIGFRKDSTAFIEDMYIETNASFGDNYVLQIPHINKLISSDTQMLTIFTPDLCDKTGVKTETLNVVLENVTDKVKIGSEFKCTVGKIFKSSEPVALTQGQYVLSVNSSGNQWAISLINTMNEGDEITIKTTAGNDIWNEAYNGLASEGERLLTKGNIATGLEAGASPRTAVGIKENGNIIFYVIDGRQSGYSYGARKDTVAKRLKELGCVDALNLDGGGSTTMAGVYPGCDSAVIVNSPSDGALRKVTNFIFIKNALEPIGEPKTAYIYPYSGNILSGSTIQLDVKTVDENYYPAEHGEVNYSCNEYGSVSDKGELTVLGEGVVKAAAETSGLTAQATYNTYITPDKICLYNGKNTTELNQIDVAQGDTLNLRAEAFYDGAKLLSSNSAYRWTVSEEGIEIDTNGIMKVSDYFFGDAILTVKAGGCSRDYKIVCSSPITPEIYPYSEILLNDNILTINMYSDNASVNKEKSYVKIDGEKYSLTEANNVNEKQISDEITLEEGFSEGNHRIFAVTVLDNGFSEVNSLSIMKTEEENPFADTNSHWAKDIISYMNKMGIVNGSEENGVFCYRPDGRVTRAEFAVMAVNFLNIDLSEYDDVSLGQFADGEQIPQWAANHVKAAYSHGIIAGKSEGDKLYFSPSSPITRAEAATIISRMLPSKLKTAGTNFADNANIPTWAKKPVEILTASGLLKGYDDNTIKPLNTVTRAEAVTMLYNIF